MLGICFVVPSATKQFWRAGDIVLEQDRVKSRDGCSAGPLRRRKHETVRYLAVAAAVASLLIVSSGFTERRSVPTWAPNAVVAKPAPAVAAVAAVAAVPAAEPKAASVEAPAAPPAAIAALPASRSSTPDPDATGTLPKELDAAPKALPEAQPRTRRASPGRRAAAPGDAAAVRRPPGAPGAASREPIQFRLAEGRRRDTLIPKSGYRFCGKDHAQTKR